MSLVRLRPVAFRVRWCCRWCAIQPVACFRSVRMTSARNPARRQRRPMSQRTRPRFPVATTDKHGHLK